MKYLIFNFSVFLALGYLIMGDQIPAHLGDQIEQAGARIQEVVREKPQDPPASERPPELKRITKAVETVQSPQPSSAQTDLVETVQIPQDTKPAQVPEIDEPITITQPVAQPVPSPRVEPEIASASKNTLQNTRAPLENTTQETSNLAEETAQDRLRETQARAAALRDIAAEMEHMFAEKMTW